MRTFLICLISILIACSCRSHRKISTSENTKIKTATETEAIHNSTVNRNYLDSLEIEITRMEYITSIDSISIRPIKKIEKINIRKGSKSTSYTLKNDTLNKKTFTDYLQDTEINETNSTSHFTPNMYLMAVIFAPIMIILIMKLKK